MGKSVRWHALSLLVIVGLLATGMWLWGGWNGARAVRSGAVMFVVMFVFGVLTDACFAWYDQRRERRRPGE